MKQVRLWNRRIKVWPVNGPPTVGRWRTYILGRRYLQICSVAMSGGHKPPMYEKTYIVIFCKKNLEKYPKWHIFSPLRGAIMAHVHLFYLRYTKYVFVENTSFTATTSFRIYKRLFFVKNFAHCDNFVQN